MKAIVEQTASDWDLQPGCKKCWKRDMCDACEARSVPVYRGTVIVVHCRQHNAVELQYVLTDSGVFGSMMQQ